MRSLIPDKPGGAFSMETEIPSKTDSGATDSTGIIRKQMNRTF